MEERIVLDKTSFMALASESRVAVLKKLDERKMTVSELAKELEKSKPAVLKHVTKLVEAGLVKKIDDERKWVYYQLTMRGKHVLHPERVKITLLLSTSFLSLMGAIFMLWRYFTEKVRFYPAGEGNSLTYGDAVNETIRQKGEHVTTLVTYNTEFIQISLVLSIIALALCAVALYLWYTKDKRNVLAGNSQ